MEKEKHIFSIGIIVAAVGVITSLLLVFVTRDDKKEA